MLKHSAEIEDYASKGMQKVVEESTLRTSMHNVKNTLHYTHTVCLCFVWISEQVATVSTYSIN
jgi:hypothetical protein